MGIGARMWKIWLHYLIAIPALLLLFVFKLVPFAIGIWMSLTDFQPYWGIWSSPWVGLDHYAKLFGSEEFRNAFGNTIALKVLYIVVSGALAFAIAVALDRIRSAIVRGIFTTLFLVPYFIPSVVLAQMTQLAFSMNSPLFNVTSLPLTEPGQYPFVVLLAETVHTLGIPIVVTLAVMRRAGGSRPVAALAAVAAFALLQLSALLSPDVELMNSMLNPTVYNVGDTVDTFAFRTGLMHMQLGMAAAAQSVQFAIHLALALAALWLIRTFFRNSLFGDKALSSPDVRPSSAAAQSIGYAVAAAYAVPVLAALALLFYYPFAAESEAAVGLGALLQDNPFVRYALIYGASTVVHMLIVATLAFPLTVRNLPGRGLYAVVLIAVTVIGAGSVSEYMFYHSLGLTNTIVPLFLSGMFGVVQAFVLAAICNSRGEYAETARQGGTHWLFEHYLPIVWKPLLALGALHFASLWNSYYAGLLHLSDRMLAPPVLRFMQASWEQGIPPGDPVLLAYGAIVSVPGIVLLLACRRWLTAEVFAAEVRKL